ncbi:Heat shock protein HslJ [Terricaulis silvestris]|uniref:Heat shock protein HslJ n=2 Tax=Terricaulis silvestris TaxID=2686094 RepID=A0A6I6MKC4_9CAUL|nr:Heat shock protein HslJ [Terricaulis silvestris]
MGAVPHRIPLRLTACMSALVAAACASLAPAPSSDLAGTRWAVRSINGQPTQIRTPSVEFAVEDRIAGGGGCNRYSGVYEAADGAIAVRALGRTEMACDTPVMRQEDAFFTVLDDADRYRRDGEQLVITAEDGGSLVLAPLTL